LRYEEQGWDSTFFGFSIGRIVGESQAEDDLPTSVAAADAAAVRCLYYLCPADDDGSLHAALNLGFRPYDVRIELERRLEGALQPSSSVHEARPVEAPLLERIARERLQGTRFWSDPGFEPERVADLYAAWLERGLSTAPQRRTLVVEEAAGFVICHFDSARSLGTIELIAVAVESAGKGLGGRLVAAADHAFATADCDRAVVVTQGRNIAAQRLYQRHGYRTTRVDLWLHRWAG
jgi:dTDP-4-amino-4,6-dideoxy-D-galactose acyltransferase